MNLKEKMIAAIYKDNDDQNLKKESEAEKPKILQTEIIYIRRIHPHNHQLKIGDDICKCHGKDERVNDRFTFSSANVVTCMEMPSSCSV